MTRAENIAIKILANEPVEVRSLVQDWLRAAPSFVDEPAPTSPDASVRAVAAGIVELLAMRHGQPAPAWVATIGSLPVPLYLVHAARESAKMRARVERESPEPLRKRNMFAPRHYLEKL